MTRWAIRRKQWFSLRRLNDAERLLYRRLNGAPAPRCVILRWPWWWRGFRGLALAWLIVVDDDADSGLVMHELIHVAQFCAAPWRFWWRYLAELWRVGYAANRYEREARAFARRACEALHQDGGAQTVTTTSSGGECAANRSNR